MDLDVLKTCGVSLFKERLRARRLTSKPLRPERRRRGVAHFASTRGRTTNRQLPSSRTERVRESLFVASLSFQPFAGYFPPLVDLVSLPLFYLFYFLLARSIFLQLHDFFFFLFLPLLSEMHCFRPAGKKRTPLSAGDGRC